MIERYQPGIFLPSKGLEAYEVKDPKTVEEINKMPFLLATEIRTNPFNGAIYFPGYVSYSEPHSVTITPGKNDIPIWLAFPDIMTAINLVAANTDPKQVGRTMAVVEAMSKKYCTQAADFSKTVELKMEEFKKLINDYQGLLPLAVLLLELQLERFTVKKFLEKISDGVILTDPREIFDSFFPKGRIRVKPLLESVEGLREARKNSYNKDNKKDFLEAVKETLMLALEELEKSLEEFFAQYPHATIFFGNNQLGLPGF
ncbi:MAG: hypothetical protein QHH09_02360 [Microgenomates group bacterium]|jgi:hypothetical protein|nr:hypothetical protein [Microgenomates group bacterium]